MNASPASTDDSGHGDALSNGLTPDILNTDSTGENGSNPENPHLLHLARLFVCPVRTIGRHFHRGHVDNATHFMADSILAPVLIRAPNLAESGGNVDGTSGDETITVEIPKLVGHIIGSPGKRYSGDHGEHSLIN